MKNHPHDIYAETPTKPRNKGIGEPPFCINCGEYKHEPMIYTGLGNKIGHCLDCLLKKKPGEVYYSLFVPEISTGQ